MSTTRIACAGEADLLPWLLAAREAMYRVGWFPLVVFLAHEICSHFIDGYRRWPVIDIPFHFMGGILFVVAGIRKASRSLPS